MTKKNIFSLFKSFFVRANRLPAEQQRKSWVVFFNFYALTKYQEHDFEELPGWY